jgi:hypothetical protein
LSSSHNPHSAAYVARISELELALSRQTGEITLLQQDRQDLAKMLLACANTFEVLVKRPLDALSIRETQRYAGDIRSILQRMNLAPSNPSGTGSGPSTDA